MIVGQKWRNLNQEAKNHYQNQCSLNQKYYAIYRKEFAQKGYFITKDKD